MTAQSGASGRSAVVASEGHTTGTVPPPPGLAFVDIGGVRPMLTRSEGRSAHWPPVNHSQRTGHGRAAAV